MDAKMVANAHMALVKLGKSATPIVEEELSKIDFQRENSTDLISLATGLAVLLHDLDEKSSQEFLAKVLANELHPSLKATFKNLQKFSLANYRHTSFGQIQLLESKDIDQRYRASEHVSNWLKHVPVKDLGGITRVYIVSQKDHFDYLGSYATYYSSIQLNWSASFHPWNPLFQLLRATFKKTLYHEIGHHKFRHNGGQDPYQEREADRYAMKLIQEDYRRWRFVLFPILWPFSFFFRKKEFWILLNAKDKAGPFYVSFEVRALSEHGAESIAKKFLKREGATDIHVDEIEIVDDIGIRMARSRVLNKTGRSYWNDSTTN